MIIDGHDYTLFRDYDKGKYGFLTSSGRVTYLEARVNLVLLRPCQVAVKDALNNSLGLVLTTAVCAGISATGTFLKGKRERPEERTRNSSRIL